MSAISPISNISPIPLTIRTDLIIEQHTISGIQTKQNTAPLPYDAFIVKSKSGDVLTVINMTYEFKVVDITTYDYILLFNTTKRLYYLMAMDINKVGPDSIVSTITDLINTYSPDCYKMNPFIDESTIGFTQLVLSRQLADNKVLYHTYTEPIDYTKATASITRLNTQLAKICPDFRITLDYVYKLPGDLNLYSNDNFTRLTLCLYHKAGCVASIQLYILNSVVNFDSFTNPAYERNKYNSLLTCIMLMIGGDLVYDGKPVTEIYAEVINKDLARVLLITFKAQLRPSKTMYPSIFEYVANLPTPITSEIINEYYEAKPKRGSPVNYNCAYVAFELTPATLKYIPDIYNGILNYYRENQGCVKQVGPDPAITHPATFTKSKYSVTNLDPAITHPAILKPASKSKKNKRAPVTLKVKAHAKSNNEESDTVKHLTQLDPAKIQFIYLNVKKAENKISQQEKS